VRAADWPRRAFGVAAVLAAPFLVALSSCASGPSAALDYRAEMRAFVLEIGAYARAVKPGFIVVPQNGMELGTDSGDAAGTAQSGYLGAIDGAGREDLFYGYEADDGETPSAERDRMLGLCDLFEDAGVEVLAIDYCSAPSKVDDSYARNAARGYISFAAQHRELDAIPGYPATPHNVNTGDVASLPEARNFLYLINSSSFASKADFLAAAAATDYDLVVMDLFHDGEAYTAAEVQGLKTKAGGGSRLVICYLSVGEAEDYRYYWDEDWTLLAPGWLEAENPDWEGNYKVRYWDPAWKRIILGGTGSYLQRILDAGFDGVYLDLIDAFEYFEGD